MKLLRTSSSASAENWARASSDWPRLWASRRRPERTSWGWSLASEKWPSDFWEPRRHSFWCITCAFAVTKQSSNCWDRALHNLLKCDHIICLSYVALKIHHDFIDTKTWMFLFLSCSMLSRSFALHAAKCARQHLKKLSKLLFLIRSVRVKKWLFKYCVNLKFWI
jgi:hypothetical protein